MLIALDTGSFAAWDIGFPSIQKKISIGPNDARKWLSCDVSDSSVLVESSSQRDFR